VKFINTLLKGMAIGVSNVIPGISAGTLMVLLGIYDELVEAIGTTSCFCRPWRWEPSAVSYSLPV
jgi:uncharacterized membrane protein